MSGPPKLRRPRSSVSLPVAIAAGAVALSAWSLAAFFVVEHGTEGLMMALVPFVFGVLFATPGFVYWRLRNPVRAGQGARLDGSSATNEVARRFGQRLNFRQVVVLAVLGPLPQVLRMLIEEHAPDSAAAEWLRALTGPIAVAIWLAFLFTWDHHIGRWVERLRGPDADPLAPQREDRWRDDTPIG